MYTIDPSVVAAGLVRFIRFSFKREGCEHALIGVSGGVDSAVSLALTVQALGVKHVHPVLLPYGSLNDEGTKDAQMIIQSFHVPINNIHLIDIKPMVDSVIAYDNQMDYGRRGNVMARMRMVTLFDLSKKMNALVVGTENKTEHLLGYYTRFGDEASDVEPLKHLYKTHVYTLARYLQIPLKISTKQPSAGLWSGQTDEGEFGFLYKDVDEALFLYADKHLSKSEIINEGYGADVIERIWRWIQKGAFKDRMPLTP